MYSDYDMFLLAGDSNVEEEEDCLREFLFHYNAKNLVKEKLALRVLIIQDVLVFFSQIPLKTFTILEELESGLQNKIVDNYATFEKLHKRHLNKEKRDMYLSNLNMNNYTDNKRFWNTVNSYFQIAMVDRKNNSRRG